MGKCESCVWYVYDEEYDDYLCDMDLDEDELARFLASDTRDCPYWRPGDEYITARKQQCVGAPQALPYFFLSGPLDIFRWWEYDASLKVKVHKTEAMFL